MDDVLEPEQLEREFKRMAHKRLFVSAEHVVEHIVPKRRVGKMCWVPSRVFSRAWGRVEGVREGDVFRVGELELKPQWLIHPTRNNGVADATDGPYIATIYPTWEEPLPEEPTFEDFQLTHPSVSNLTTNGPDANLPKGEVPFIVLGVLNRKLVGGVEIAVKDRMSKGIFYIRLVGQLDEEVGRTVFLEATLDKQNGILVIAHVHKVFVFKGKKKKNALPQTRNNDIL